VDVLLVLLIIFMIITPLTPVGLSALIPQPPTKNSPAVNQRTVVVEVNANGGVDINQHPVAMADLRSKLLSIFATRAERVVFIKGDRNLNFGGVAKVIDIAQGAGIDKIGLLPENERPTT